MVQGYPKPKGRAVVENKECFGQKEIGTLLSHTVTFAKIWGAISLASLKA
jgi:hypothetical protein